MARIIRHSEIKWLAERLGRFGIRWATRNGHWAEFETAEWASTHSEGDTINIAIPATGRRFTVIIDTITRFDGAECSDLCLELDEQR